MGKYVSERTRERMLNRYAFDERETQNINTLVDNLEKVMRRLEKERKMRERKGKK